MLADTIVYTQVEARLNGYRRLNMAQGKWLSKEMKALIELLATESDRPMTAQDIKGALAARFDNITANWPDINTVEKEARRARREKDKELDGDWSLSSFSGQRFRNEAVPEAIGALLEIAWLCHLRRETFTVRQAIWASRLYHARAWEDSLHLYSTARHLAWRERVHAAIGDKDIHWTSDIQIDIANVRLVPPFLAILVKESVKRSGHALDEYIADTFLETVAANKGQSGIADFPPLTLSTEHLWGISHELDMNAGGLRTTWKSSLRYSRYQRRNALKSRADQGTWENAVEIIYMLWKRKIGESEKWKALSEEHKAEVNDRLGRQVHTTVWRKYEAKRIFDEQTKLMWQQLAGEERNKAFDKLADAYSEEQTKLDDWVPAEILAEFGITPRPPMTDRMKQDLIRFRPEMKTYFASHDVPPPP